MTVVCCLGQNFLITVSVNAQLFSAQLFTATDVPAEPEPGSATDALTGTQGEVARDQSVALTDGLAASCLVQTDVLAKRTRTTRRGRRCVAGRAPAEADKASAALWGCV